MPSAKTPEQDQDHRPHGQLWSDYTANVAAAADEAGVVKTRYARLAHIPPEEFKRFLAEDESRRRVEPPIEHVGEVATEHSVSRQ